jgi:hypothetical protein
MASIQDLFTDIDPTLLREGEEPSGPIDFDRVLNEATAVLNGRKPPAASSEETPPSDAADEEEESEEEGFDAPSPEDEASLEGSEDEPGDEEVPASPPAASSPSPFDAIPPERREALLALDQIVSQDPAKRAAVFGALSGDSEAPAQPKTPTLPPEIDPDSFEAKLWLDNQELKQQVAGIAQFTRQQAAATEAQQNAQRATIACQNFATRYADKLTEQDVKEIAQYAGAVGLPAAFMGTAEAKANPIVGYEQALESALWTNELFRSRVLGTAEPVLPGNSPEAKQHKRKLHAVGASASPVSGPTPKRSPLQSGPDGKLSETSRQDLVKEFATKLRQT